MAEAFIKIHRKMLEWEWYTDTNTFCLFLHCLLIANWKEGRFMGHTIPRGSFVSSYSQLARQTNMSIQNVRTAVSHLKSTGELTVCPHAKFSVFTVVNYNKYQDDNRQTNKQVTSNQQATNKQLTTIKEYKNSKNGKNKRKPSPLAGGNDVPRASRLKPIDEGTYDDIPEEYRDFCHTYEEFWKFCNR